MGRLGASWGGFGAAGGVKNIDFPSVFQYFLQIDILSKHGHLSRSWGSLEPAWASLGTSWGDLGVILGASWGGLG